MFGRFVINTNVKFLSITRQACYNRSIIDYRPRPYPYVFVFTARIFCFSSFSSFIFFQSPCRKFMDNTIDNVANVFKNSVACSTTTVTKCQAGLRTLQAFPVFHPTCLCREPSVDPDCNAFRDSLFDHPCMVATQKGKHPETNVRRTVTVCFLFCFT